LAGEPTHCGGPGVTPSGARFRCRGSARCSHRARAAVAVAAVALCANIDDSMRLLLDAPRDVTSPPAVPTPVVPTPVINDISLPPVPALPGTIVKEGKRAIKGAAWKSVREEIERELTEDAELEINGRIVKKPQ